MIQNVDFRRFDRSSKVDGFNYASSDIREFELSGQATSLGAIGFNCSYNIKNYMAEPVLLSGSLRSAPTKINSLRRDGSRQYSAYENSILITILYTENTTNPDPKKRTTQSRKTEIKIPAKMLHRGSVFIQELDCYIMLESQIDATRGLIAKDLEHQDWDTINIPDSMVKNDPEVMYVNYKELVETTIKRKDKLRVRIGVNLTHGKIPDAIRNMRISILDSYFVPFDDYKLVYDPTLGPDEFYIENLYPTSNQMFHSTFSELDRAGVIYLDYDQVETMFGKFYGMAVFKDQRSHADYVYARRAAERFDEESLFVANRSGDPRLREEVARLKKETELLQANVTEKDGQLVSLQDILKKTRQDLSDREKTIKNIQTNHDASYSEDAVRIGLENDQLKQENERLKLENDRRDQDHREQVAPMAHKATMLKTIADILKSGWGITTACTAGIFSIIALCKKYNVRLVMST